MNLHPASLAGAAWAHLLAAYQSFARRLSKRPLSYAAYRSRKPKGPPPPPMMLPPCPQCQSHMARRIRFQDALSYWGCSRYPLCKGQAPSAC